MIYPTLYHVLHIDGTPCNGGKGRWHLPKDGKPGKWMLTLQPPLIPREHAYHLCTRDQLVRWLGPAIFEVELFPGVTAVDHCGSQLVTLGPVRLVRRLYADTWTERTQRLLACDSAEHVLSIYEAQYPGDTRPRDCIAVARRYAVGDATDAECRAAQAAAGVSRDAVGAARGAAWAARHTTWTTVGAAWATVGAARVAARGAAWEAEWRWQTERLWHYLDDAA